jgi:hypothetical protein
VVTLARYFPPVLLISLCLTASTVSAQLVKYGPWCGAVTSQSVEIVMGLIEARLTTLELSTHRDFPRYDTWAENSRAVEAPPKIARYSLFGLQPETTYYYRIRAGTVREYQHTGSFRTLPREGTPHSFRFAIAADARRLSQSSVYSEIRFQKPTFFLHLGNAHDAAFTANDPEPYFQSYREALTAANQSELFAAVPVVYTWDRLDFGGTSADRLSPSLAAAHLAYRYFVPHYPLDSAPDTTGVKRELAVKAKAVAPITQAFTCGRVRFLVLDTRTARDPVDSPDGPEKSMLGTWQLDWLKQELLTAAATHPLIFIASSVAWHGIDSAASDDWARYATERLEISRWIRENNIKGVCFLSGNGGTLATHDGSIVTLRSEFNFPEFHVGPIDVRHRSFQGEWTQSPIIPEPIDEFFGLVKVEDKINSITVTFTGLNQYAQEQLRSSFTLDVPRP